MDGSSAAMRAGTTNHGATGHQTARIPRGEGRASRLFTFPTARRLRDGMIPWGKRPLLTTIMAMKSLSDCCTPIQELRLQSTTWLADVRAVDEWLSRCIPG
jgi:hypothetical protein